MKLEELKNKKILIIGKGIEGQAAYKYLKTHLSDSKIDIVDQNTDASALAELARYGSENLADTAEADENDLRQPGNRYDTTDGFCESDTENLLYIHREFIV